MSIDALLDVLSRDRDTAKHQMDNPTYLLGGVPEDAFGCSTMFNVNTGESTSSFNRSSVMYYGHCLGEVKKLLKYKETFKNLKISQGMPKLCQEAAEKYWVDHVYNDHLGYYYSEHTVHINPGSNANGISFKYVDLQYGWFGCEFKNWVGKDGLPVIWCWAGIRKTLTESKCLTNNYYGDGNVYYAQNFKYEDVVKLLHQVSEYEHKIEK